LVAQGGIKVAERTDSPLEGSLADNVRNNLFGFDRKLRVKPENARRYDMTIFQKAPGMFSRRRAQRIATAVLFLVALFSLAMADDPIFRVARISLVEGEVSFQRANDSRKDWFDATLNLPLEENDQLYSASDGRAEIQLSGRNTVRIDHDTNLRFSQFNTGVIQMSLPIGSAYFRIDSLSKHQFQVVDANDTGANDPVYFEIDTPTVAVTFVKEGVYRINVRDDGSTEVIVRQGQAEVYNQEIGTVVVKKGRRIIVEGRDDYYRVLGLEDKDNWDRWNDRRDNDLFSRMESSNSARYVPLAIPGVYDLDSYGEWIQTPEYGWMWCPRGVASDWAPYRQGYWRWYPRYGWTWISYEPWGWTPYHYGRWAYVRDRWCWAPFVNIGLGFDWLWRPHHVVFFGWGGSYGRGYRDGYYDGYWDGFRDGNYGWLGWCPLSPRDRHYEPRRTSPRLEAFGNFHAPGGVSGMDARRFTGGRAVVSRDVLNAPVPPRGEMPPRGDRGGERSIAAPALVRNEDLKPLQPTLPTRNDAVSRGGSARRIEAPVIFRRTPVDASGAATPGSRPNREGPIRDGRTREGQTAPSAGERGDDSNQPPPTRISNGRVERPSRTPDFKRADRGEAPPPRPRDVDRNSSDRRIERPNESANPPRNEPPSRSEKRSDDAPRRYDPPARPQVERHDPPPQPAPNREIRRSDPPPSRDSSPPRSNDSSPPRSVERPSSPPQRDSSPSRSNDSSPPRSVERPSSPPPSPPQRDSSPSRPSSPPPAPEKPSSPPPARENAPSRPAEGSSDRPTPRRPNNQ
jgi:FecR protein